MSIAKKELPKLAGRLDQLVAMERTLRASLEIDPEADPEEHAILSRISAKLDQLQSLSSKSDARSVRHNSRRKERKALRGRIEAMRSKLAGLRFGRNR